jgi:hypothetical protein
MSSTPEFPLPPPAVAQGARAETGAASSPAASDVRDALLHHLGEGGTPDEAVDAVLLILDHEATRVMAELGVRTLLQELVDGGQVTLSRPAQARGARRHPSRLVGRLAELSQRAPRMAQLRLRSVRVGRRGPSTAGLDGDGRA